MDKKSIRQSIKRLTNALLDADKRRQSQYVISLLRQLIIERKPSVVALFMPLGDELQLGPFIDSLASASMCRVVLPRVETVTDGSASMEFYDYQVGHLSVGSFGISEPSVGEPCAAEDIDLMVVPGVAFTRRGERLGRGKGFYDCYISRSGFRAYTVGVCYSHQIVESLPVEPHDKGVDEVISGQSL